MKTLVLFLTLFISPLSFADAWDNLTEPEAIEVINYLQANPYIFNYCDCCQSNDDEDDTFHVLLIKVTDTRIVPCSWDEGKFSVEYDFDPLASIAYKEDGSGMEVLPPDVDPTEEGSALIYMNYTWGFNAASNQARPLFESIDYGYVAEYGGESCNEPFTYPTPEQLEPAGSFKAYKVWWKKSSGQ